MNTTDVIATIADILHLGALSHFDYFGRPLRDVFAAEPDRRPYAALRPATPPDQRTGRSAPGTRASTRLALAREDEADEDLFNRVLWRAIKGTRTPYPGPTRMAARELRLPWRSGGAP